MKKVTFIGLAIIILIIIVSLIINVNLDNPANKENNLQVSEITSQEMPESTVQASSGISSSELSTHNKEGDCWVAYSGKVYDITSYLNKHPGGKSTILSTCGTSSKFENLFTGKHGTSKVSVLEQQAIYKGELV